MISKIALMPHPPVVVPEVGGSEWVIVEKTFQAMSQVAREFSRNNIRHIFLVSPHGPALQDGLLVHQDTVHRGSLRRFGFQREYIFGNDLLTVDALETHNSSRHPWFVFSGSYEGEMGIGETSMDHGALVPLYFLEKEIPGLQLVRLSAGFLSREALLQSGRVIKEVLENSPEKWGIIISGDMSHRLSESGPYGFSQAGPVFDEKIRRSLEKGRLEEILEIPGAVISGAGQCGYLPLVLALGIAGDTPVSIKVLQYEAPFGVGYLTALMGIEGEEVR